MKVIASLFFILIFSTICFSMGKPPQEIDSHHNSKSHQLNSAIPALDKAITIDVTITGMTCAICDHGIEKKLKENSEIQTIYADFDTQLIRIITQNKPAVTDDFIETSIDWAGYKVITINRY